MDIYFSICKQVGINPVVAYVQYGLESGFGYHRGVVLEDYCNPCGLKVTKVGANLDSNPNDHAKFKLIQFMKEVESVKLNVDEEYKRAVTKLSQELDISMATWYPEPNPKNLIAMVQKIGRK